MNAIIVIILSAILPACPTEDSANCYWDASLHNDPRETSVGVSFVDVEGTAYLIPRDDVVGWQYLAPTTTEQWFLTH